MNPESIGFTPHHTFTEAFCPGCGNPESSGEHGSDCSRVVSDVQEYARTRTNQAEREKVEPSRLHGGSIPGALYTRWDCPVCGEAGEDVEGDATGETVTCTLCNVEYRIEHVT